MSSSEKGLSLTEFKAALLCLAPTRRYLVAFSGGLDSGVLVDLCARLRRADTTLDFTVVHVHHGLVPDSRRWVDHCASLCKGHDLTFRLLEIEVDPKRGESPEEAARNARYQALRPLLETDHCLMTAHHMDDQAETILLQLMRGAGVAGLSGMAEVCEFGRGILARPLLGNSRQTLRDYAVSRGLAWVDDPSNVDTAFDRNFLRHDIVPVLKSRWPSLAKTLTRAGRNCFEAQTLLSQGAKELLEVAWNPDRNTVSLEVLESYDAPRQRLVLREWVRRSGFRFPSEVILRRILAEVMGARTDRSPLVVWDEAEVRRYRSELYLLRRLSETNNSEIYRWRVDRPLELQAAGGVLDCKTSQQQGLDSARWRNDRVTVGFRRGGESLKLAGRQGRHSLKKLFQEKGVPPWIRDRLPLIYIDDQLAAVSDLWICEPFLGSGRGSDIKITWTWQKPVWKSGDCNPVVD